MITLVYGVSGSGKSSYIENEIRRDVDEGKSAYLIVPEQQTYVAERRYTAILPPSGQLSFEVVNFTRLANKAFRSYGGLSYNYIDSGMKALLMWQTLRELAPLLEEYGSAASSASQISQLTSLMLSTDGELRAAAVSPQMLEAGARHLPADSALCPRLRDVALICASYEGFVSQSYDDAADDLTKLASLLEEQDFFSGKKVYIDSFTSYTAQEYKIIDRIFKQAESVTVTVGCESPNSRAIHFASLRDTSDRLRKLASERGGFNDILLGEPKRFAAPELALLEKYLWRMEIPKIPDNEQTASGHICLYSCPTPYAEAEAAANRIICELRGGMRCRDIAVIVRDAKAWSGIVDAVFDKFGIPYFLSERTDLASKPLIKLVISALRIKNRGWRQNDVISHIKTGLCGFSDRETDIFEDYCSTWNINAQSFTGDAWSMNPDGYTTVLTERGTQILSTANDVKLRLSEPLISFFTALDTATCVRDMCRALYEYTEKLGVRKSLAELAARERALGSLRDADETLRLYDIYIETLDKIAGALPDEKMNSEEFASALSLVFSNADMGAMPTRQDEVTIGSASLLRADSPRLVIAMGLNEGEFPADVRESGIFSGADRTLLGSLGIELSADPALRSSEELFFAYRALTAPSDALMLTYSEAGVSGTRHQPSSAFVRAKTLFDGLKLQKYDQTDLLTKLQTPEASIEYLKSLGDTPEATALRLSLSKLDGMSEALASLSIPVSDSAAQVSRDTAGKLFGDKLGLSQSRLESYVLCRFSYFCDYVLGLRKCSRAEFSSSRIGDFIHYIMEHFMREATRSGHFDCELTDEQAAALADRIITEYASKIIPGSKERESRLSYLFARLRRIALVMISSIREEFRHSLFSPAFFELKIDGSDPVFPESAEFEASNGEMIKLRGVIDRVDLFRRGDDVYIRVVDYKTGSREYSPSDVAEGLGLQLLLYLFTLCRTKSGEFRRALGCPADGHIYPAGALYLSANLPVITVDEDIDESEIRRTAQKAIKRSGPLLSDDEILSAMNDELDPTYLGGVKKDASGITKGKYLLSSDDFSVLCDGIEQTIGNVAAEMRSGAADAAPKRHAGSSPCDWCDYSRICRSAKPSKNRF